MAQKLNKICYENLKMQVTINKHKKVACSSVMLIKKLSAFLLIRCKAGGVANSIIGLWWFSPLRASTSAWLHVTPARMQLALSWLKSRLHIQVQTTHLY